MLIQLPSIRLKKVERERERERGEEEEEEEREKYLEERRTK
jgi:hypothetical protein